MIIIYRSDFAAQTRRSLPSAQAQQPKKAPQTAAMRDGKSSPQMTEKCGVEVRHAAKLVLGILVLTLLGRAIAAADPLETAALKPCRTVVCEISPSRMLPPPPNSARPRYDLDTPEDIMAGRGRQRLSSALAQIAVYASLGNRDAVEILANRLQEEFGVSREEIEEAMTWTKIHPHR